MKACGSLMLLSLLTLGGSVSAQECRARWVTPLPPRVDLVRVFERSGLYVAVGEGGVITTSTDRLRWTVVDSRTRADLHGVTWGEGTFAVVGDGVLVTSGDGESWTRRTLPVVGLLTDVAYGDGRFVAIGPGLGETALTSEDGRTWQARSAGFTTPPVAIASSGSEFLVVTDEEVFASDDGLSWSFRGQVPATRRARAKDHVSRVGLAWSGDSWIWAGGTEIYRSRDGTEWQFQGVLDGCDPWSGLFDVAAGGGRVVAAGVSVCPDPFLNPDGVIMTSTDSGSNWTTTGRMSSEGFLGVARGSRGFVAVGHGGDVAISSDALSWSCEPGACSSAACADDLFDVAMGRVGPIAVGGVGQCDLAKRSVGATVALRRSSQPWEVHEVAADRFTAVAWNGTRYVAVGRNLTATSADGVEWATSELIPSATLRSVAWGEGTFVAVGDGGTVVGSSDGLTWGGLYSNTTQDLVRVVYVGDRFVAVGDDGTVLTSPEGYFWTREASNCRDRITGVGWDGQRYLILGGGDHLWASVDLSHWQRHETGVPAELTDLAVGEDLVVAVGRERGETATSRAVMVVSRDGVLWTHVPVPGWGLRRVLWTGDGFVAVGHHRTLVNLSCTPTLVTVAPALSAVGIGESIRLVVGIEEPLAADAVILLSSSHPEVVTVPDSVRIPAGQVEVEFSVSGTALLDQAVVTATLPAGLGGAWATALVEVEPPLPDPRRPGGRVGGG